MNLFIAGRNGQVARSLAEVAAARGVSAVFFGRDDGDITNAEATRDAIARAAPDAVINAAAYTAVDAAESDGAAAYDLNAWATRVLATAAGAANLPFIHLSTDYVFNGTKALPYVEGDAVAPLGVYGRSKLEGEYQAAEAAQHLIVRTSWVFSPFGKNFVKTMLRIAAARDEVDVVADQFGNPTSALDLAGLLVDLSAKVAQARSRRRVSITSREAAMRAGLI